MNRAVNWSAMLRTSVSSSFKANFSAGGQVAYFEINPAVEWLSIECARLIGLDIMRPP